MKKVSERPRLLKPVPFHYCPGCGHSIAHRLVAEAIDDLGMAERTVGVAPAGCAVLAGFPSTIRLRRTGRTSSMSWC